MSGAIDEAALRHVATLARLAVPADRIPVLTEELGRILEYVRALERVDVGDETTADAPAPAFWRADEVVPGLERTDALGAAALASGSTFVVPKVVG